MALSLFSGRGTWQINENLNQIIVAGITFGFY